MKSLEFYIRSSDAGVYFVNLSLQSHVSLKVMPRPHIESDAMEFSQNESYC